MICSISASRMNWRRCCCCCASAGAADIPTIATAVKATARIRTLTTSFRGKRKAMLSPTCRMPANRLAYTQIWQRLGIFTMAAAALAGCASNQPVRLGAHQVNAGIAADEPRAAAIGRDILSQGGNAVDAATAMALAMSVTLPTRVGLGGGGVCVVHDATSSQTRTIDFLPRTVSGSSAASGNGDAVAVPSMVRGIAALHAAHGKMRWEQLVVPAEAK